MSEIDWDAWNDKWKDWKCPKCQNTGITSISIYRPDAVSPIQRDVTYCELCQYGSQQKARDEAK